MTTKVKGKPRNEVPTHPDEEYITFVSDKQLKRDFQSKCFAEERTMSGMLRFLMKAYIENKIDQNLVTS